MQGASLCKILVAGCPIGRRPAKNIGIPRAIRRFERVVPDFLLAQAHCSRVPTAAAPPEGRIIGKKPHRFHHIAAADGFEQPLMEGDLVKFSWCGCYSANTERTVFQLVDPLRVLPFAKSGVEGVAQTVAQQVEAEHGHHDRQAGKDGGVRGRIQIGTAIIQNAAP